MANDVSDIINNIQEKKPLVNDHIVDTTRIVMCRKWLFIFKRY